MKPKAWRADLPAKLVRAVIEVAPGNGAGVGDVSWVRGTLARLHHLMSGLIGHSMYGILALKEARGRGLQVAPLMALVEVWVDQQCAVCALNPIGLEQPAPGAVGLARP